MKAKPTTNQFLAEAQAKEISRQFGVAYVKFVNGLYWANLSAGYVKFENGKQL